MSKPKTLPGIRCVYCGARSTRAACAGCAGTGRPTPLRVWLSSSGVTAAELAERAGCRRETIQRAVAGRGLRGAVAVRVARETGIPLATLVIGGHGE